MCHSDAHERGDPHSGDGARRAVHGVVADVSMFAIDYDALHTDQYRGQRPRLGNAAVDGDSLTSRPVCATICAVRKEGSPRKVVIGFSLDCRALRKRRRGLRMVVVSAEGKDMFSGCIRVFLVRVFACYKPTSCQSICYPAGESEQQK